MDKLKSVMDFMKKFGFWLLLGLIVVMVISCWWLATSSVAKEVKEKSGKIDETFKKVQSIADNSQHPNEKYLEAMAGVDIAAVALAVLPLLSVLYCTASRGIGGLVDVVKSPMYATGVGLVIWGSKTQASSRFKVRESNIYAKVKDRMKEWFGEIF